MYLRCKKDCYYNETILKTMSIKDFRRPSKNLTDTPERLITLIQRKNMFWLPTSAKDKIQSP